MSASRPTADFDVLQFIGSAAKIPAEPLDQRASLSHINGAVATNGEIIL
jgi:hypothetical protein